MTDPQTLFDEAQCYICQGVSLAQALELALLARIANGAGGAGNQILSGNGSPVGVVVPTTTVAIYFDQNDGTQYNFYGGAWH